MNLKLLKSERGLTLIEIMIVIAIIATIAGIASVALFGQRDQANIDVTKSSIAEVMKSLNLYRKDNFTYPSTEQGLEALVEKPTIGKAPKRYPPEGYLDETPKDAWGTEFEYASPGTHGQKAEIWSCGPDQECDTEDDVNSWDSEDEKEK